MVDETYQLTDEDKANGMSIKWDWMTEIWEGYRVGTDIHLDMGPVQYQYTSLENPRVTKLPYVGVKYNATKTRNKSLTDKNCGKNKYVVMNPKPAFTLNHFTFPVTLCSE